MSSPRTEAAPFHDNTIDSLLVNQLLWVLLFRVLLYTLLLGLSAFLQSGHFNVVVLPPTHLFIFIVFVYVTSISSGLTLLKKDIPSRRFGIIQILLDTFFVSILIYYTGGLHSIFSPIYFFPIIVGGLLLPRLGGLVAAGAATLQYAFVLTVIHYQFFPHFLHVPYYYSEKDWFSSLNLFAVYGLLFFLVAVLSSLFAGRLKKTEDALSDSVRNFDILSLLYKQIFDDINTGIITTNELNQISSANNAASLISGYSIHELLNKDFHIFFPNVNFTGKGSRHSATLTQKDGTQIRIGYSYGRLLYKQPENADDGKNSRVVTIQDISEVERLEKQMQQAEKLAAIGRMSAGIAHDFRNPLTAISGSAQVLAKELKLSTGPQQQINTQLINIILRESDRLSKTVSNFLKFARPEHVQHDWFSFKRSLDEVIQVAKAAPSWPSTCTLDARTDNIVDIWADQHQLFTLLNHLLQNALAFVPMGKEIIRITAEEVQGQNEEPDKIEITVEDNGPGIEPGKEEKIFEPFFTRRVDGTGLGLAIVKQITLDHQGRIMVGKSSLGGAKFTVWFPLP